MNSTPLSSSLDIKHKTDALIQIHNLSSELVCPDFDRIEKVLSRLSNYLGVYNEFDKYLDEYYYDSNPDGN